MLPFYVSLYGNPHSRTHAYGWESEKAVEVAREVDKFGYILSSLNDDQILFFIIFGLLRL